MQGFGRDQSAVATLRRRIAEVEQANGDLIAYARGHSGAAQAIHAAVLAILPARTPAALAAIVAHDWPAVLDVEAAAMAWCCGDSAFGASRRGVRAMDPRFVARMATLDRPVEVRSVARGHPLFGEDGAALRAEIRIVLGAGTGAGGVGVRGLILLGGTSAATIDDPAAGRLLRFLGHAVSAMLDRWSPT